MYSFFTRSEFIVGDEFWSDLDLYNARAIWVVFDVAEKEREIFR